MTTAKPSKAAKSLPKKKIYLSSAAKEFYSGFAENVRESYIPRFVITEKETKPDTRAKSDK